MISNNDGNIGIGFAVTAQTVTKFMNGALKNGDLMPPPSAADAGGYGGGYGSDGYGSDGYGADGTKTAAKTEGLSGEVKAANPAGLPGWDKPKAVFKRFLPRPHLLKKGDGFGRGNFF
eukprot:SAG22_NODE_2312_length_2732_cov_1.581846_2_plen_118_part_00